MKQWESISHTADCKVIIRGSTYAELFEAAYESMIALTEPVINHAAAPVRETLQLSAPSADLLLIDFLSHALYILEAQKRIITNFAWQRCTEHALSCMITTRPYTHLAGVSIKAVTFHDLAITTHNGILQTPLIFDI